MGAPAQRHEVNDARAMSLRLGNRNGADHRLRGVRRLDGLLKQPIGANIGDRLPAERNRHEQVRQSLKQGIGGQNPSRAGQHRCGQADHLQRGHGGGGTFQSETLLSPTAL